MAEIIGPDGKKYYSEDHNSPTFGENVKEKLTSTSNSIVDYLGLIGGAIAVVIGLYLLADIAIGLILLFMGSTSVNYWLMKHRK